MLASCLVAVLLGRHLTPGLWTSENFRKHTNVTNVAYKLYRAQDLYMCNARSDKTWSKGRTWRENDRYNRYNPSRTSESTSDFTEVIQRGATEFREFGQLFRLQTSTFYRIFCTKILQVEPQKRKKKQHRTKTAKKEAAKGTVFQTLVPIASRGTKR